ncbi:Uncharacterised protein [Mycobacteroides abscessus subsp. abscessus]|nr:Uncharacterised protein [Mycobacteroides abscessus subsp. abscessus]
MDSGLALGQLRIQSKTIALAIDMARASRSRQITEMTRMPIR